MVPRYDSGADIARRAGINRMTFAKLSAARWCPQPDIRIGTWPGWNPYRSVRWLRETGRIDIHGRPSRATRIGRPAKDEEPPDWYNKQPVRLLTATEAAFVLGKERKIIRSLRNLGIGPEPAACIGDLEGYTLNEILRVGRWNGWVYPGDDREVRERFRRLRYLAGAPALDAAGVAPAA